MFIVYGAPGSGSVIVEGALTLMELPYRVVDVTPWGTAEQRAELARVSPLKQVPVLELPDGSRMTESAAMLLWLGEQAEGRAFAPAPGARGRADYLRWLVFIPAAIYPMYTLRDNLGDWVPSKGAQAALSANAVKRVSLGWRTLEAAAEPRPYLFGDVLTFLDLYVTVASRWTPKREVFYRDCPKLGAMVRRVDADPRLQGLWRERFPLDDPSNPT